MTPFLEVAAPAMLVDYYNQHGGREALAEDEPGISRQEIGRSSIVL